MKISQTWRRNIPTTIGGESITLKITFSNFNKSEIDELEEQMPKGVIVGETLSRCQNAVYAHQKENGYESNTQS